MEVHRLKLEDGWLMHDKITEENRLVMLDRNIMDPVSILFCKFTQATIMHSRMARSAQHTRGGEGAHDGGGDGANTRGGANDT